MLAGLNYSNLDEHPDFAGKLSTTEALAQYIAEAVAAKLSDGDDGRELAGLDVTLRENPDAWATYSLDLTPAAPPDAAGQPIRLLVPGNIRHNSGGNVYNARSPRALPPWASRWKLPVDGSWPDGSAGRTTAAGGAAARRPGDAAKSRRTHAHGAARAPI